MHARMSAVLCLVLASAVSTPAAKADSFEDAVLAELNHVRENPQAYARELRAQIERISFTRESARRTAEDRDAVDEAIEVLERQPPLPPLARDPRLAAAARRYAAQQGPTGEVGHGPPGSFGRRFDEAGVLAGHQAESISYGQRTPRDVIRQLVVDSGVPDRGHRKQLLDRNLQLAGVGCGRHARWGSMCVIDYAGLRVRR
jgi:uncharacterized protein YkwD